MARKKKKSKWSLNRLMGSSTKVCSECNHKHTLTVEYWEIQLNQQTVGTLNWTDKSLHIKFGEDTSEVKFHTTEGALRWLRENTESLIEIYAEA